MNAREVEKIRYAVDAARRAERDALSGQNPEHVRADAADAVESWAAAIALLLREALS